MKNLTVIDIGAFGGIADGWKSIGQTVDMHAFEANKSECIRLSKEVGDEVASLNFYPTAISGKTGPQTFHHTKSPRCSSLVEPDPSVFEMYARLGTLRNERSRVIKEESLDTLSLDDFCAQQGIKPDFVKLDTQGNEFEILSEGSLSVLPDILGLEIEVEFIKLYKEQALFTDIDLFLRGKGFSLIGLLRNHWKMNDTEECPSGLPGGRLTYADALYFREDLFTKASVRDEAIKAALLLFRYNLWDCTARILKLNNLKFSDIEMFISIDDANLYNTLAKKDMAETEKEVFFDTVYGRPFES